MIECRAITNGIVIKSDGVLMPCCSFKPDANWISGVNVKTVKTLNDYFTLPLLMSVRKNFEDNIQDSRCTHCWQVEVSGTGSWREIVNAQLPAPGVSEKLLVELRLGNACNLRCYTCGPTASSKVQQDWVKLNDGRLFSEIVVDDWTINSDNVKLAQEIITRAKILSITGGEPFYNKNLWNFLNPLRDKDIEISITTNGSYVPFDKLRGFSNLILSFSIDAINEVGEYVRFGSNWNTVKENFERSVREGIRTHANLTLSLYNLFSLSETVKYFNLIGPSYYHFNFVMTPTFLSIDKLHPSLKDEATGILFNLCGHEKNFRLRHALQIIGTAYTDSNFKDFVEYTNKLDSIRGIKLEDRVPQYRGLMG